MACAANAVSCVRNDSTGSLSLYLAAPVPRSRLLPFSLISSLYRVFQKIAAKFQVAFLFAEVIRQGNNYWSCTILSTGDMAGNSSFECHSSTAYVRMFVNFLRNSARGRFTVLDSNFRRRWYGECKKDSHSGQF